MVDRDVSCGYTYMVVSPIQKASLELRSSVSVKQQDLHVRDVNNRINGKNIHIKMQDLLGTRADDIGRDEDRDQFDV